MQPWEGRSLWVWNMTSVDDVIAKAKAMNADSVIVKSHDGSRYWDQFNALNVVKLKQAGLKVGAWGYCYPTGIDIQTYMVSKTRSYSPDFYVCDAEIEFEHVALSISADALMSTIRKMMDGTPVGFTSFAFPSYHPDFPWQEFAKYSDFTMPQIYWGDFKRDVHSAYSQSVNEYKKLGKPVVPIGQLYGGVSNSDITIFLQLSGASSSWWDYAHLTPSQYSAFPKGGANMQQGSTGPEVVQLQKDLSLVLKIGMSADGAYGPYTTSAVKSFQQQYGVRPVDGIAGPVTMAVLKHEVSLHTITPPKIVVPVVQPKVEPKPEPTKGATLVVQYSGEAQVYEHTQPSNVSQARELLTQALKLLEGVE